MRANQGTIRQQRGRYKGPVTIVGPDGAEIPGSAALAGYVEMEYDQERDAYAPGSRWWIGNIEAHKGGLNDLVGSVVDLRAPDGRHGQALVLDISGSVEGRGKPPFEYQAPRRRSYP